MPRRSTRTYDAGYAHLTGDPLASWIEDTFGVTEEQESGRLIRRPPTTVDQAAANLSEHHRHTSH